VIVSYIFSMQHRAAAAAAVRTAEAGADKLTPKNVPTDGLSLSSACRQTSVDWTGELDYMTSWGRRSLSMSVPWGGNSFDVGHGGEGHGGTPVKLAHTPCANVTPRGQGCVAASYVCLLLISTVILYTWKMHHLAFCGSQICKEIKIFWDSAPDPAGGAYSAPPAL